MNQSEINETINAPREKVWEILFSQYGDINIHNPLMTASSHMQGATEGGPGVLRHTEFGEKLHVDEQITEVDEHKSFRIEVREHNLPFLREMAATYELSSTDDHTTDVSMVSFNSYAPRFMKYLMGGQARKTLAKHLFGMKYYIETGKTVDQDNYADVFAEYT